MVKDVLFGNYCSENNTVIIHVKKKKAKKKKNRKKLKKATERNFEVKYSFVNRTPGFRMYGLEIITIRRTVAVIKKKKIKKKI